MTSGQHSAEKYSQDIHRDDIGLRESQHTETQTQPRYGKQHTGCDDKVFACRNKLSRKPLSSILFYSRFRIRDDVEMVSSGVAPSDNDFCDT